MDWKKTQQNLAASGYSPGAVDGKPGRMTYTALLAYAAKRPADAVLRALGAAMAVQLPPTGISDSPARMAEFLAQTGHETRSFSVFEESMRYSAKRLMQVWPSRFPTLASAMPFAWDPTDPDLEDVALANFAYGGRMGNERDGTNDNDGWDHRGGGLLQHTGAEEYLRLAGLGISPDEVHTDFAKMVTAACDYWLRKNINSYVDRKDLDGARRKINGGLIGIDDIGLRRDRLLKVLA